MFYTGLDFLHVAVVSPDSSSLAQLWSLLLLSKKNKFVYVVAVDLFVGECRMAAKCGNAFLLFNLSTCVYINSCNLKTV